MHGFQEHIHRCVKTGVFVEVHGYFNDWTIRNSSRPNQARSHRRCFMLQLYDTLEEEEDVYCRYTVPILSSDLRIR